MTEINTNDSRRTNVQSMSLTTSGALLTLCILLTLIIQAGVAFWIHSQMVTRENNLKKDFDNYKIEVENTITALNENMNILNQMVAEK